MSVTVYKNAVTAIIKLLPVIPLTRVYKNSVTVIIKPVPYVPKTTVYKASSTVIVKKVTATKSRRRQVYSEYI
ncbi:hypothetical protein [Vibrio phage VCPH]|nr:hypothetical protein [Vibrio phage VCPH]